MFVWDRAGAIAATKCVVQRDLARLAQQMKELFPSETIAVQSNGTQRRAVRHGVEQGR